ncbi:SHOCT-like domain-containing protein [Carnobacterium gallinarum]|uniref:SHOCT-like domain-containing protein n=1 Tax=Carnobacterium gallinarum TaxID=2749 RepID=UPI00055619C3|nr:hypothetical protein [Carnobacterium gallinarum]
MNQKERILDLVKQGLITAEEALVLLENTTKPASEKTKVDVEDEYPDDWKESVNETMNQVTEKVTEASAQVSKFAKKTLESVNEHLDWKEVQVKVPKITSTELTHEFIFSEDESKVIDLKVANGKVVFKNGVGTDLKIVANVKIYGKLNEDETSLDAYLKRITIEEEEGKLDFISENKRINGNLVVYLPQRAYEIHVG